MKIIKTKKYSQMEEYNPYKVDFNKEGEKARNMDTDSLFFALKDAIEASQKSANEGKYYDQASVYRTELKKRGFSFEEQDRRLQNQGMLHPPFRKTRKPIFVIRGIIDFLFPVFFALWALFSI